MDSIKILREELPGKLLALLLIQPIALLSILWKPIQVFLTETLPTLISNRTLFLLLYLLLWLLSLLVAFVFLLRKELKNKPDFSQFTHDPDKQCWVHETTGQRICAACKLDNKLSALNKFSGGGWICPLHTDTVVDYPEDIGNLDDNGELSPTIYDDL